MTTGQRIKAARKKAGMTQAELAKKLGISYVGISQWERDLRNPKQETIQRIAKALECDFYWLLWGEELSIDEIAATDVMRAFNTNDYHVEKTAKLAVFYAEKEYKRRGYSFTTAEEQLVKSFSCLNSTGQQEAVKRVEELTEIPKYQKEENPAEDD